MPRRKIASDSEDEVPRKRVKVQQQPLVVSDSEESTDQDEDVIDPDTFIVQRIQNHVYSKERRLTTYQKNNGVRADRFKDKTFQFLVKWADTPGDKWSDDKYDTWEMYEAFDGGNPIMIKYLMHHPEIAGNRQLEVFHSALSKRIKKLAAKEGRAASTQNLAQPVADSRPDDDGEPLLPPSSPSTKSKKKSSGKQTAQESSSKPSSRKSKPASASSGSKASTSKASTSKASTSKASTSKASTSKTSTPKDSAQPKKKARPSTGSKEPSIQPEASTSKSKASSRTIVLDSTPEPEEEGGLDDYHHALEAPVEAPQEAEDDEDFVPDGEIIEIDRRDEVDFESFQTKVAEEKRMEPQQRQQPLPKPPSKKASKASNLKSSKKAASQEIAVPEFVQDEQAPDLPPEDLSTLLTDNAVQPTAPPENIVETPPAAPVPPTDFDDSMFDVPPAASTNLDAESSDDEPIIISPQKWNGIPVETQASPSRTSSPAKKSTKPQQSASRLFTELSPTHGAELSGGEDEQGHRPGKCCRKCGKYSCPGRRDIRQCTAVREAVSPKSLVKNTLATPTRKTKELPPSTPKPSPKKPSTFSPRKALSPHHQSGPREAESFDALFDGDDSNAVETQPSRAVKKTFGLSAPAVDPKHPGKEKREYQFLYEQIAGSSFNPERRPPSMADWTIDKIIASRWDFQGKAQLTPRNLHLHVKDRHVMIHAPFWQKDGSKDVKTDITAMQIHLFKHGARYVGPEAANAIAVFVHISTLTRPGAIEILLNDETMLSLREEAEVLFFVFGRQRDNLTLCPIWDSGSVYTFTPEAIVARGETFKEILKISDETYPQSCVWLHASIVHKDGLLSINNSQYLDASINLHVALVARKDQKPYISLLHPMEAPASQVSFAADEHWPTFPDTDSIADPRLAEIEANNDDALFKDNPVHTLVEATKNFATKFLRVRNWFVVSSAIQAIEWAATEGDAVTIAKVVGTDEVRSRWR